MSIDSRSYYDLLADNFEQENQFWDNPYDTEVWRLEHEVIGPYLDPHKPLLDVGCGFYPHDNFPLSVKIVAGDISFRSLLIAKKHPPIHRTVDLVQFDAHCLPFADGSFRQAVAGGELFNHINYCSVAAELARVISPDGFLLVGFGAKWCLDSLWALSDRVIGNRIGYSLTADQAKAFFKLDGSDVEVTWQITPRGTFNVKLLGVSNVRGSLEAAGFSIVKVVSTNFVSGVMPLPWQQDADRTFIRRLTGLLIRADRMFGRVYPLNLFAGNIFMLCGRRMH